MPKRRAGVKRLRVDKKRHLKNLKIKTELKKTLKKFNALMSANNVAEAKAIFGKVSSLFDKAAKKNVIHPNTADRKKSRLAKKIQKTKSS